MAAERKPVTIHYRRFDRLSGGPEPLETLVRRAMNVVVNGAPIKTRYLSRVLTIGGDNYFVNTYKDDSLVFGDVLHFTKGHLQALCKTADEDAAAVPVQQMKAPEQSEYVHSQMFWMIKGDHAFVIQSLSLKTEDFERYLNWLLKNKSDVMGRAFNVTLMAKFDEEKIGGDLDDIQEIVVGGAAPQGTSTPPATAQEAPSQTQRFQEVTQHGGVDTSRSTGWATARAILRELLGGDANVESLMKSVPPDAELNVQVHIGFQTKKRKAISRIAMNQLEVGLRNLPDSQLQIRAKGARVATDGSVRLHHNASVRLVKVQDGDQEIIGTLLDPVDVLRAMVEGYSYLVSNGKIPE